MWGKERSPGNAGTCCRREGREPAAAGSGFYRALWPLPSGTMSGDMFGFQSPGGSAIGGQWVKLRGAVTPSMLRTALPMERPGPQTLAVPWASRGTLCNMRLPCGAGSCVP